MAETPYPGEHSTTTLQEIERTRRSPRRAVSVPVWLRREGQVRTWEEETETRVVSRYGAGLSCRHSIETGATLVIVRRDNGQRANARVIYCRHDAEGHREIGIELVRCEDFWSIDWTSAEQSVSHPETLRKPSGLGEDELVPGDQSPRKRRRARRHAQQAADILTKEKKLWDAMKAKNMNVLESLIAPEFFWISSDGVHTKLTDLQHVLDTSLADCSLDDGKVTKLNKDIAIVMFQGVEHGSDASQLPVPSRTWQTSVWVYRGGKWQVVFHQRTRTR